MPSEYANHGRGLFFVGVEANGLIYAYALDYTASTFKLIATIQTGFTAGVMDLTRSHRYPSARMSVGTRTGR